MSALFLLLCVAAGSAQTSPGVQAGISLAALNGFKNQAIPVFLSQIGSIQIPDQESNLGTDLEVQAGLGDIVLSDIHADTSTTFLSFVPPSQVSLQVADLALSVSFNWNFTSLLGSGAGTGFVAINSSLLAGNITIGEKVGHCTVNIAGVLMNIGELTITMHGDPLATVVDWVVDLFHNKLKEMMETAIQNAALVQGQQALDSQLSQFSIYVPIGNTGISIDYDLVQPPQVQIDFVMVSSLAMFVADNSPNYSPPIGTPATLPGFDTTGEQVQVTISDFTINTALFAAASAGLLQYTVTPDVLPSNFPLKLDTTYLNALFPGLETKYGANLPCSIACSASPAPSVTTTTGDITGTATGTCLVLVNGETVALGLAVTLDFSAAVSLASWEVQANIISADVVSISAFNSTLSDPVNADGLEYIFNVGLRLAVPIINENALAKGIPLPHIQNVDLSDAVVTPSDGFLFIAATPVYNLTLSSVPPRTFFS